MKHLILYEDHSDKDLLKDITGLGLRGIEWKVDIPDKYKEEIGLFMDMEGLGF